MYFKPYRKSIYYIFLKIEIVKIEFPRLLGGRGDMRLSMTYDLKPRFSGHYTIPVAETFQCSSGCCRLF